MLHYNDGGGAQTCESKEGDQVEKGKKKNLDNGRGTKRCAVLLESDFPRYMEGLRIEVP